MIEYRLDDDGKDIIVFHNLVRAGDHIGEELPVKALEPPQCDRASLERAWSKGAEAAQEFMKLFA